MGKLALVAGLIMLCVILGMALLVWADSGAKEGADSVLVLAAKHGGSALLVSAVLILFLELVLADVRIQETRKLLGEFFSRGKIQDRRSFRCQNTHSLLSDIRSFENQIIGLDSRNQDAFLIFFTGYFRKVRKTSGRLLDAVTLEASSDLSIDAPLRKELLDEAFGAGMEAMNDGDEYVTVTCPKFWSRWNMGVDPLGRFLFQTRQIAIRRKVSIRRVFVVFGRMEESKDTAQPNPKWIIDQYTREILREHVNMSSSKGPIGVRVWCTNNAEQAREYISTRHMGAWRIQREGEVKSIAFIPEYFRDDEFILQGVKVLLEEESIGSRILAFDDIWAKSEDISVFLEKKLSTQTLPELKEKDPTRPYPGPEEWIDRYKNLKSIR